MNETIGSTATTVNETPLKKFRFSKKTFAIGAGVAATVAAAVVVYTKSNSSTQYYDIGTLDDNVTYETLSDLDAPKS